MLIGAYSPVLCSLNRLVHTPSQSDTMQGQERQVVSSEETHQLVIV